ncbi:MAG: hypothetical protein K2O88_09895 [Paramuribaculum sp.]|nr:hypothetical protein [Paramuribaculum sp.]
MDMVDMRVGAEDLFRMVCVELDEGRTVTIPVNGDSMWPFIRRGDVVVLGRKVEYEVDDIVFALTDCGVMLHAVVGEGCVMGTRNLCRREKVVHVAGYVKSVVRGDERLDTDGWRWRLAMVLWRLARPIRRLLVWWM